MTRPRLVTVKSVDEQACLMVEPVRCRQKLPDVESIDKLVTSEPRLLQVNVEELLQEVARLLPDRNPQQFLAQNPAVRSISGYTASCACTFT